MGYLKPTEEGYYWYRNGTEWDDEWDIVKVQEYSGGGLRFKIFGWQNLNPVEKSEGIWGEKIADIRELEEPT